MICHRNYQYTGAGHVMYIGRCTPAIHKQWKLSHGGSEIIAIRYEQSKVLAMSKAYSIQGKVLTGHKVA